MEALCEAPFLSMGGCLDSDRQGTHGPRGFVPTIEVSEPCDLGGQRASGLRTAVPVTVDV